MGRLDGKVALITGAARGQGRSHALTFAREGADIVASDISAAIPGAAYPASTQQELAEVARQVGLLGRRCIVRQADARDSEAMGALVGAAMTEFGHIDVLHVNHGIVQAAMWDAVTEEIWDAAISINLTAAWRTTRLVIPHMIKQGSGSIIFTASSAATTTSAAMTHYAASKAGLVGLMKALSVELAPHSIRVNSIAPGAVATPMIKNQTLFDTLAGRPGASEEDARLTFKSLHLLPIAWLEPQDISNAALFLASDEARYVTGVNLPVDGGTANQPPGIPPAANEELARLRQLVAAAQ